MNSAFYASATGMLFTQQGLNVASNNIANLNTTGYKGLRASFSDVLYTIPREQTPEVQIGHGAYLAKTDLSLSTGALTQTGGALDFALPNAGFFAVEDGGEVAYTRDGSFHLTQVEDHWELVNGDGSFVLDYEGNHIVVPFEEDTQEMDANAVAQLIGVYTFENPYGLSAGGGNTFLQTDASGEATPAEELVKLSGALESSNVDLAGEMIKVLEAQRAYQLNARVLQTADEFQRIANTLR